MQRRIIPRASKVSYRLRPFRRLRFKRFKGGTAKTLQFSENALGMRQKTPRCQNKVFG
jgi:hypothetical protein